MRERAEREKVRVFVFPMLAPRRLLFCTLFLSVSALAGCSSQYWHSPSILTTAPPEPPKQNKREAQGGFSVLVEAPGQPTVARATRDIGAFAQRRGFVHFGTSAGGERYVSGKIVLDVGFRASDSRVVASLHSFGLNRKFAEGFYREFDREFGRQYGDEDPVLENDYVND